MASEFSIAKLYVGTFNRAADADGLAYWKNSNMTIEEIAYSFFEQIETKMMYPEELSNKEFVLKIYQNLFNRLGEEEGINYWCTQLQNNVVNRSEIILSFMNGALGDDALLLAHKTGISLYYANCGLKDVNFAHKVLDNVSVDVASLQQPKEYIDSLDIIHANGLGMLPNKEMSAVEALLHDVYWKEPVITYSFNEMIPLEYYNEGNMLIKNWQPFNVGERQIVHNIFDGLEEKLSVQFLEVSIEGKIRFNKIDMVDELAGFCYCPNKENNALAGDVFIDNEYDVNEGNAPGSNAYLTIVHETGHALGLKHPFEGAVKLPALEDNTLFTVMTYSACEVTSIDFFYDEGICKAYFPFDASPSTYQLYDVMALQAIYGINKTYATESDRYMLSDLSKNKEHTLIWDAGGNDTLDLSDTLGKNKIILREGTLSSVDMIEFSEQKNEAIAYYLSEGCSKVSAQLWVDSIFNNQEIEQYLYTGDGNLAIAQGVLIENVITGSGNDIIYDNYLNNTIETGAGDDHIYLLDGGYDIVIGGAGNDSVYIDGDIVDYLVYDIDFGKCLIESIDRAEDFEVELWEVESIVFNDNTMLLT